MKFLYQIMNIWDRLCLVCQPFFAKLGTFFREFGRVLDAVWKVFFGLRKVFAAIPVGFGAVVLAMYNFTHLPGLVGIGLQINSSFSYLVVRPIAVLGPLAITAFCLLLMFISKKILTPWFVSLFTLVIPVFLLITNTFPQ